MLTNDEYNKLLHDVASAANTIRKLKDDVAELILELDATANDLESLKEKIK